MSRSPNLNDLQLILLSTAAQRDDGSVLPAADSIADQEERIRKALTSLLRRSLIEEVPIRDRTRAWREEDEQHLGLALTSAGRAIIAAEDEASAADEANAPAETNEAPTPPACTGTKAELVLGLLRRSYRRHIADAPFQGLRSGGRDG